VVHFPSGVLVYFPSGATTFKGMAEYSRFSDAGKLMALASFSKRITASEEEEKIIEFLLQDCAHHGHGSVRR
jgi:hypothetical protein